MDPDGWAVQTRVAWRRRGMQIRPTAPIHTVRHTAEFWRQSMPYRVTLGVLAAALLLTTEAAAQTAQRFSIQLSALGVQLTGVENEELAFGGGGELQLRWNPSAFSIGLGGQTTRHEIEGRTTVTFKGKFLEPRLILTTLGEVVAVYGSGRLMSLDATYYDGNAAGGATGVTRLGLAVELG